MNNNSLGENTENTARKNGLNRWVCAFAHEHQFKPLTVKITIALLCALLFAFVMLGIGSVTLIDSKPTALGLKNIGELATQAGYFTSVQVIREARDIWGLEVPFTQSSYIFSYDGIIKAGIDFENVEMNVDERNHTISVKLPEIRVLNVSVDEDSLVVYDEDKSIFTPLTVDKMNSAIADLKLEAEKTAIENGLLDNARSNAEILISGYLASLYDLQVYSIIFE